MFDDVAVGILVGEIEGEQAERSTGLAIGMGITNPRVAFVHDLGERVAHVGTFAPEFASHRAKPAAAPKFAEVFVGGIVSHGAVTIFCFRVGPTVFDIRRELLPNLGLHTASLGEGFEDDEVGEGSDECFLSVWKSANAVAESRHAPLRSVRAGEGPVANVLHAPQDSIVSAGEVVFRVKDPRVS